MAELKLNTSTSIIDFLKSQNKPSDFASRKSLYDSSELEARLGKYVSSGSQNVAFLKSLNTPTQTGIPGLAGGTPLSGGQFPSRDVPNITPLEGGNIARSEVTADQALNNIMEQQGTALGTLTQAQLDAQNTRLGRTSINTGEVKAGVSIANEKIDQPSFSRPAFGLGGLPTGADLGLSMPREAELADLYFNSTEYQSIKEKAELSAQGVALMAQTAKENLEAKYAADKAQLETTLGRNGLWFSGIRSTQVAALAQSLAMSQNQFDRGTAQKLLESDQTFKADIIKGIGDLFKEAKADNKEALGQLNQAGFALIGNSIVPTLAAQRYQTTEERARMTQELAISSFNQRLTEFAALERQRATSNAVEIKRLNISMQNANTSAERNVIMNQIRQISLLQKTAVSPGQIISSATGLPVKLTKEQTDYYAGIGTMMDTQIPSITTLLGKVTTGGIAGRYMSAATDIPGLQNTLSSDQQALIQQINQMNNSLIYLLSGKQINQQEFVRLQMQLPSLNLTNSQNTTQIGSFQTIMQSIYDTNLALNGFAVAGGDVGQTAVNNMIMATSVDSTDPLDDLAAGFMTQ